MKRYVWLVVAFGLASCAVGPKYQTRTPDELNVPAAWHSTLPENAKSGDLSKWWQQLNDPLLTELVEEALTASPTMESARARLREARAQRKVVAADLYPIGLRPGTRVGGPDTGPDTGGREEPG